MSKVQVAKWLNAFKEAYTFNIRLINKESNIVALDTHSELTRHQILSRVNQKTELGNSYEWFNEGPPKRNVYGRPLDIRFLLLDLDTTDPLFVERAMLYNPRIHLQSSAGSTQQWFYVPWIKTAQQQVAVAKYLCAQVGLTYEAANFNQLGRLPYFMNKKPNRPGNFRAKMLGYDPKAICTITEHDIEPPAKRMRVVSIAPPKPHVFADAVTEKETRIAEHDWQAAMKNYEGGFNFCTGMCIYWQDIEEGTWQFRGVC